MEELGSRLAEVSDAPGYPYEFNVVNSSTPNAYALPGGFISVTRGLLLEMTSEDQLAAVLGHEIVHVTARHAAQQRTRSTVSQLLLSAGNIYLQAENVSHAGLYQDLGSIGARAILSSYSRAQEKLSDRVGMRYMAKAG
ncbi:MAG: M48 family metalloprotease [bacterium]